jgi:hypothetical protein
MIESHQIADLHLHSVHRTWSAGIRALGKQITRSICSPSARRVGRTMLVPRGQIQQWAKEAEMQNAKVTDHDLLVAFIYKVSILPYSD